jgi:hypothetical protein
MPDYKHIFLAFLELVVDADKQATFVDEDIYTLTFNDPQPDDPTVEEIIARAKEIAANPVLPEAPQ